MAAGDAPICGTSEKTRIGSAIFLSSRNPRSEKGDRQFAGDVVANRARNRNAAGLGQGFEARCDIDGRAEHIAIAIDDIAHADANTGLQFGAVGGMLGEHLLQDDRAAHRIDRARELGHDAVARGIGDPALMPFDLRGGEVAQIAEGGQGCGFVGLHAPRIADDIGGHDRRKPAIGPGGVGKN